MLASTTLEGSRRSIDDDDVFSSSVADNCAPLEEAIKDIRSVANTTAVIDDEEPTSDVIGVFGTISTLGTTDTTQPTDLQHSGTAQLLKQLVSANSVTEHDAVVHGCIDDGIAALPVN